ncbi:MAG TPA: hypothetical protein VIF62_20175 [Labilithrix sp.]|jgi:hypothetical protein
MDDASVFDRFLSLAKRELQAADVRLLEHGEAAPQASNTIVSRLPDGRHVVASFEEEPKDRDVLERRLAMLAGTFAEALATPPSERTRTRPPVMSSLAEELRALRERARGADVVVIDIDSPVVWASASVGGRPRAHTDAVLRDVSEELRDDKDAPLESGTVQDTTPSPLESSPMASNDDEQQEPELTRRAIAAMRRLPLDRLHKGHHLRHVQQENDHYLVLSFSGIYLLAVIFDAPFDELRAERAMQDSMPRIERLVLALPPLDPGPEPMGGVVALRRRRR